MHLWFQALWSCLPQVCVSRFWMMHWEHSCPKRTVVWSSSRQVLKFNLGKLCTADKLAARKRHGHVQPVDRKINKQGRKTYTGNHELKGTQTQPQLLQYSPTLKYRTPALHVYRSCKAQPFLPQGPTHEHSAERWPSCCHS